MHAKWWKLRPSPASLPLQLFLWQRRLWLLLRLRRRRQLAAPLQVLNPTYVTIPMEITVNKPVKDVWGPIGKYCDIAEWFQIAAGCTMTSGKEGEVGSVRAASAPESSSPEPGSARTPTPQPVREGRLCNLYHGNR